MVTSNLCISAGDVLYELLQQILKQRKSHVFCPSAYFPGNSFHSLPESSVQPLKLEGQSIKHCFFFISCKQFVNFELLMRDLSLKHVVCFQRYFSLEYL